MPDYATQWSTVWSPYHAYGVAPGTDQAIKIVVEEVEKLTLRSNLKQLDKYLKEVEAYRTACRGLHAAPANPQFNMDEQRLMRGLTGMSGNFVEQIQMCLRECARAVEAFQLAGVAIKRDGQHATLVRAVLTKLQDLSTHLTADLGLYGNNMTQTLQTIRHNP